MSRRYSIRRFRAGDMARILEIERASFGRDAYDRKLFAEFAKNCGGLFLVALGGRRVCGYTITCICADGSRPAELVSLAVDPAARRTGAARALMDSTLRRLRRRGVARWSLMVKVTNKRARAFYERYGFRKVRLVRAYYEDGRDGVRMLRQVS